MTKNTFKIRERQIILFGFFFLMQITIGFAEISVVEISNPTPGNCDGKIKIEAEGTAKPFTVLMETDNGFIHNRTNVNGIILFDNLCAGDYQITVINKFMCETMLQATLNECSADGFQLGFTDINNPSSCNGNDGGIRILGGVSGGVEPYQLEWSNNMTGGQITNLSDGTYTVTITDAAGCTDEESFELVSMGLVEMLFYDFLSSCQGLNNGEAEIFAYVSDSPSQPSFSYLWSNGATTDRATGLAPGTHCVTVTNNVSGCSAEDCLVIQSEEPNGNLSVDASITNTCPNESKGRIALIPQGGNPPYSYVWDTPYPYPGNGQTIINQPQGTYCTTVTDHCNVAVSDCFTIGGPTEMSIEIVNIRRSCPNYIQGAITLILYGGIAPFSIESAMPGVSSDISIIGGLRYVSVGNFPPGYHTISIIDDCGQIITTSFTVEAYSVITVENNSTCQLDDLCSATGDWVRSWGSLGIAYVDVYSYPSEFTCEYFQVCNTATAKNDPIFYGEIVSGEIEEIGIVFDGLKCITQRVCRSPDGLLSHPYFSIETSPQMVFNQPISPGSDFCVDQKLCDGNVVWQSVAKVCIRAIEAPTETTLTTINKSEVSKIISDNHLVQNLDVFPNPFSKEINIIFQSTYNQKVQLRLFNMLGEEVWKEETYNDMIEGENQISVDINRDLPSGLYIFEVRTIKGERFVKTIVHEKE